MFCGPVECSEARGESSLILEVFPVTCLRLNSCARGAPFLPPLKKGPSEGIFSNLIKPGSRDWHLVRIDLVFLKCLCKKGLFIGINKFDVQVAGRQKK